MPPSDEVRQYVAMALTQGPKVALRIGWRFLKVKKKAQRAETVFKRRLIDSGMDPESARLLAEQYSSTVSVRYFLQTIGVPGRNLDNGRK